MSAVLPGEPARRILIVEDAPGCAETLEAALSAIPGITMTLVANAETALAALGDSDFAAVITDINLPLMDGIELVASLRAAERFVSLPILVISGDPDPDAPQRALLAGANAFFSKPFSPSAVRRRLEDLLDEN